MKIIYYQLRRFLAYNYRPHICQRTLLIPKGGSTSLVFFTEASLLPRSADTKIQTLPFYTLQIDQRAQITIKLQWKPRNAYSESHKFKRKLKKNEEQSLLLHSKVNIGQNAHTQKQDSFFKRFASPLQRNLLFIIFNLYSFENKSEIGSLDIICIGGKTILEYIIYICNRLTGVLHTSFLHPWYPD